MTMATSLSRAQAIVSAAPVVPVVTVEDPTAAVGLARALVAGGLPAVEITLRTARALDAIAAVAREVPDAIVGAGTILSEGQILEARDAGAKFLVSPGASERLALAAAAAPLPFLPGCATVSEAMTLAELGFGIVKFFPAEASGGVDFLKSVAPVLQHMKFCPTGGIDAEKAKRYLALPNVVCIGGSWVAPADAVAAGDWARITELARAAAQLRG